MLRTSNEFREAFRAPCVRESPAGLLSGIRISKMSQASQSAVLFQLGAFSSVRMRQIGFSIADQALAVGGMFLANVALARTQSKEEYGIFALSYSVFTFFAGLHNGAILETYTVYGSGRYNARFAEYARLLWRSNAWLGLFLTAAISTVWGALYWAKPALASPTILGLAVACGFLLTGSFVRRTFYIRRRPDLAARFSLIFFATCAALLWLAIHVQILSGFTVFAIAAVAWIVAAIFLTRELPGSAAAGDSFTDGEPGYWSEHWKYSRWVLVTALVFQLTNQMYYWLSAGILSVKETGDLRAMYNLVGPVDQVLIAMSFLVLPMMSRRAALRGVEGVLPVWKAYCAGSLVVTGGFAACVNLVGKPVMHFLYAGKFDDVAPLLGMLALLPVIMTIGNSMNAALKAMEKPNFVFYAYVCSGSTTVLLGVPLVTRFGLRGVVDGLLLSAAAYTVSLAAFFLWIVTSRAGERTMVRMKYDSDSVFVGEKEKED
jgi:O-antigen/teichoic acid export membrane protein